jgi:hypothetical protein
LQLGTKIDSRLNDNLLVLTKINTMQKQLLLILLTGLSFASNAQNINDHKFTFQYVQLPMIHIDDRFKNYEIRIDHSYLKANEDSTAAFNARKIAQQQIFDQQLVRYQRVRDSLDRAYLRDLATWEKNTNNGVLNASGVAPVKPNPPMYPEPPYLRPLDTPFMHSVMDDNQTKNMFNVEGYTKGLGGFIVSVTIHPLQFMPVRVEKKGEGPATKYEYQLPYVMPLSIKVESPTQGVLLEQHLYQQVSYYGLPEQKSQYDHELYMMDNKRLVYQQVEVHARNQALTQLNSYLNDQVGYPVRTRNAELYSVKKHRDYEYSDVTNAYTEMTQALSAVKTDKNRASAMAKIDKALQSIEKILNESDINDSKARINDKVVAVLLCNKAELLVWKAAFDDADATINLILNSGEGKAKRHIQDEQGFYSDQRTRWKANY